MGLGNIYKELDQDSAIQLAKELNLFPSNAKITSTEIGDGNLNYVFRLKDISTNKSIIIKQALPYAKVVGESWPLTLKRATFESEALKTFHEIIPEHVPKIIHTDETLAITIMEDLSDYTILRKGLIDDKHYPKLANHIGIYMAKTLFFTSDFGLNQQNKKEKQQQFSNPELCKITEDLVFTDPFFDSETNNFEEELRGIIEQQLWQDEAVKFEVAKMKWKFLTKGEALLHGDLHTGSIFVTEKDTKIIDPEFAFYGPIGFDIGQYFANLLLNGLSKDKDILQQRLQEINQTWEYFEKTFREVWENNSIEPYSTVDQYCTYVLSEIYNDTLGFAGCEMIRRTIGLAHVADLDGIEKHEKRIKAKKQALLIGRKLLLDRDLSEHILM